MVSWVKFFGLFGGFLLAHLAPIRGDDELVHVAYINGSDDQEIYINSTDPIDLDSEAGRREAARKGISMVDADGEQPVYIGRPDSILSMDESVVQVAQILGVFGDKTVGFFGMGSSPPRMYYYSSY